jgi:hypothetical protein
MNPLLARQLEANRSTEGNWHLFAGHRKRVTRLILHALSHHPSGRACVLGAGNCNDLTLDKVARHATEIHLVDVDGAALERGRARANVRKARGHGSVATLFSHADVDLTGLSSYLLERRLGSTGSIVQRALECPQLDIGQPFDVVISAGLLTQLISLPVDALGEGHPDLTPVILAVRTGHLRLMSKLLEPGGHGVLVTDVVSSDTAPGLTEAPHETLPQLLREAIRTGNFFTGTNPASLVSALCTDPWLGMSIKDVQLSRPWRWCVAPSRAYLTVALTFRRVDSARSEVLPGPGSTH